MQKEYPEIAAAFRIILHEMLVQKEYNTYIVKGMVFSLLMRIARLTSSEMDDALLSRSKPLDVENVSQIKPALDYIAAIISPQSGFRTWLMPAASVRRISEKFSRHL